MSKIGAGMRCDCGHDMREHDLEASGPSVSSPCKLCDCERWHQTVQQSISAALDRCAHDEVMVEQETQPENDCSVLWAICAECGRDVTRELGADAWARMLRQMLARRG